MPPLLPRFHARAEAAARERQIAQIVLEVGAGEEARTVARATLAGDDRRLRGIPMIGRGVGGCLPGANPVAELMRAEHRREPH